MIDDGSTDKSLEIARSISDPRITVISDGKNKKLPYRLNQIIDLANGQYIARMDADDLCAPSRIEKQMNIFASNPNIDVVGTGILYLDPDDKPLGEAWAKETHKEICGKPYRTFRICHASILAKKDWYVQHRYNESALLVEDFHLWLNSHEDSCFANVADPLYYYRCETSFSQKKQFIARIHSAKILFQYFWKKKKILKAVCYSLFQFVKMIASFFICMVRDKKSIIQRRYCVINDIRAMECIENIKRIKEYDLPIQ